MLATICCPTLGSRSNFTTTPRCGKAVKDGSIRLNAKTIYTRTPNLTEVGDQPFSLTPEVTQALQQAIDNL